MTFHTDCVRAIGIFKTHQQLTPEEIQEQSSAIIEHIRSMPIIKANLTKYEVSYKVERLATTLASDLGLKETEFMTVVVVEGESHEKIREALTHPDFKAVIAGSLENAFNPDDFHFFSSEFVTII
ncbi:hypothetical protein C8R45DRAFT_940072 [Mycena sanguinolenta]|nr:hypothetical protein C8R45DRAFT_940072 [Mycena sanguinolenta]